jgi:hypothetical protein
VPDGGEQHTMDDGPPNRDDPGNATFIVDRIEIPGASP